LAYSTLCEYIEILEQVEDMFC